MSEQRTFIDYLRDMLEYASLAEQFVAGQSYATFETDQKTQLAVLHAITIVGEAASKIPASVREQHPAIPWRNIITMRNRLIHAYPGTDLMVVWDTILHDLPPLKAQIAAILDDMDRSIRGRGMSAMAGCPDMKITYDSDVDALSIRFKETTVTTEHLTEGVALDYDADGSLAGVEILDAQETLT